MHCRVFEKFLEIRTYLPQAATHTPSIAIGEGHDSDFASTFQDLDCLRAHRDRRLMAARCKDGAAAKFFVTPGNHDGHRKFFDRLYILGPVPHLLFSPIKTSLYPQPVSAKNGRRSAQRRYSLSLTDYTLDAMGDFFSGLQQKVNDTTQSVSNKFSDAANGNIPADGSVQQTAPPADGQHEQDLMGGARGGLNAAKGFKKQHDQDQAAAKEPGKKSLLKKASRFFKSAFGYGNSARKGENALEDLTGRDISVLPHQQMPHAQQGA